MGLKRHMLGMSCHSIHFAMQVLHNAWPWIVGLQPALCLCPAWTRTWAHSWERCWDSWGLKWAALLCRCAKAAAKGFMSHGL